MGRGLHMRGVAQIILLLALMLFVPQLQAKEGEKARIERLLRVVAVSRVSFIIEGTVYSSDEMAQHLRNKLENADKKDVTVEYFISRLANASESGKPYKVALENGQTTYAGPWFRGLLNDIEKGRLQEAAAGSPPAPTISP